MPHPARTRLARVAVILSVLSLPAGCGNDESATAPAVDPSISTFFLGLPDWEQFSPSLAQADSIAGTATRSQEAVNGISYDCTTTPYSIVETPDKIVTLDPDANVLWLGALLEGDGYRDGIGSLREWTVRERAPIDVSIDLLSASNTRRVVNPTLASVNSVVAGMVQAAADKGHKGGSSISFSQEDTWSVNQGLLALGISAKYASVSVKASFAAFRSAAERTVTAYFVQRMFTVSMVMPSEPGGMFSADFTPQRLQQEQARGRVGPANVPVYVASITYGRVLAFSFTSTASVTDIRATLAASFSSIAGAAIAGRYLDILNQADIKVVAIGGEGRNATALIRSGQLKDYFEDQPALTSARPISYVVRNLGDNSIARVSETSDYNLRECAAIPNTGVMHVDVSPNDVSVYVSGPDNYTSGPSTGDQNLADLPPGGYTIRLGRTGYDSMFVDTTVTAGDTIAVFASLHPVNSVPKGAYYTFKPTRLTMLGVGCTGESQADVYGDITVNGVATGSIAKASSVPLYVGESATLTGTFADTIRTGLTLVAHIFDDDGAINAPDPMGNKSVTWNFPNIPTGTDLYVTMSDVGGCSVRLFFNITKGKEVFTAPPVADAEAPIRAAREARRG